MTDKPIMPLYVETYLAGTRSLTFEEQGVYMCLMCNMWISDGKLPDNDEMLARILGLHINKWRVLRKTLSPFLQPHSPGYITQKRLDKEYHKIEYRREVNKQNAHTRWNQKPLNNNGDPQEVASGSDMQKPCDTPDPPASDSHGESKSISLSETKDKRSKDEIGAPENCGKLPDESGSKTDFTSEMGQSLIDCFTEHHLPVPRDIFVVSGWILKGANLFLDILPTVKAMLKRNVEGGHPPPESWKYFAKEVFDNVRKRKGGGNG